MNEFEAMKAVIMSVVDYAELVEEPDGNGEKTFDGNLRGGLEELFGTMPKPIARAIEGAFRKSFAETYMQITWTAINSIANAIIITAKAAKAGKEKEEGGFGE